MRTAAASCRYNYRENDFYNAVQWAIGLELFLLIDDPWRVFFTTDHPERRAVHDLSGDLCPADGSRSARELDAGVAAGRVGGDDASLHQARVFAQRDRHDDARGAGPASRPEGSRTSRRRRGRRRRGLRRPARQGENVPRAPRWCSRTASSSCATAR